MGTDDESALLTRAAEGSDEAWVLLMGRHRRRLRQVIAIRLDARLAGRLDPSDVVQEVFVDAVGLLPMYVRDRKFAFALWLRFLAADRLIRLHRHHLGTRKRDAAREVSLSCGPSPEVSAIALADRLCAASEPPDADAIRAERVAAVQAAMGQLDPLDREVIALRHYEQLTAVEAAQVLGITSGAAAKRHFRAVRRLRDLLAQAPGGLNGLLS